MKAKTIIDKMQVYLKIRPLISQYKHPIHKSLKLAARGIRLLQGACHKHNSYKGFEMPKMNDLPGFIEDTRAEFADSDGILKAEEWDIDDMFNNIPINTVYTDLSNLCTRIRHIITRSPRLQIYLHIATDPNDDHISTSASARNCTSMDINTLLSIVYFDLHYNKHFRLGRCIFRQKKGTAQGGYLSSELACLYVESREDRAFRNNDLLRSPSITRFRDNINIIAPLDDPIWENTRNKLMSVYRLPLKLEHSIHTPNSDPTSTICDNTQSFTTLETTLTLSSTNSIHLSMKNIELDTNNWARSSGLRKWITSHSDFYDPIAELTFIAYFHKCMQKGKYSRDYLVCGREKKV